jgi:hypothetical protein
MPENKSVEKLINNFRKTKESVIKKTLTLGQKVKIN